MALCLSFIFILPALRRQLFELHILADQRAVGGEPAFVVAPVAAHIDDQGVAVGEEAHGRRQGWTYLESFKTALKHRPKVVLLHQFNESAGQEPGNAFWYRLLGDFQQERKMEAEAIGSDGTSVKPKPKPPEHHVHNQGKGRGSALRKHVGDPSAVRRHHSW